MPIFTRPRVDRTRACHCACALSVCLPAPSLSPTVFYMLPSRVCCRYFVWFLSLLRSAPPSTGTCTLTATSSTAACPPACACGPTSVRPLARAKTFGYNRARDKPPPMKKKNTPGLHALPHTMSLCLAPLPEHCVLRFRAETHTYMSFFCSVLVCFYSTTPNSRGRQLLRGPVGGLHPR